MVEMNLTEQDKIILDHILFNNKGIDEDALYFELELYYYIKDSSRSLTGINISFSLIKLKMERLISNERIYFRNGESIIVYKGIK
jgi:hypothetical protein